MATDKTETRRARRTPTAHPKRRALLWSAGLLGVLLLGWLGYARWNRDDSAPSYVTVAARRGDVSSVVTATGNLSPLIEVQVGSLVSGRIKELHADYNSKVEAGQVLAIIDPRLLETAVAQATARLVSARADLVQAEAVELNARLQHERTVGLIEVGAIAAADGDQARATWQTARAQVEVARAAITQARAGLEVAEVNLTYTVIRSPIDGVVVSRSVDVGQSVAASLQAPTLFVIAEDLRKMEVHTSVAESDVGQLAVGQRAEFTVDAYPSDTFAGEVKEVRYEAITISNVVTYVAIVTVDNTELKLRPGMTANVTFVIDERHNVLLVPNRALRYRPAGEERSRSDGETPPGPASVAKAVEPSSTRASSAVAVDAGRSAAPSPPAELANARRREVWVLRDGRPQRELVVLGLSDGTDTEIVEGNLAEGDQVIVAGGEAAEAKPTTERRRGPPRVL